MPIVSIMPFCVHCIYSSPYKYCSLSKEEKKREQLEIEENEKMKENQWAQVMYILL